jgi:hypothetical protein
MARLHLTRISASLGLLGVAAAAVGLLSSCGDTTIVCSSNSSQPGCGAPIHTPTPTSKPSPNPTDVPTPSPTNSETQLALDQAAIVGKWLGPFPESSTSCGSSYGEYEFAADGGYEALNESDDCGGFTNAGTYTMTTSSIYFYQTSSSSPESPQTLDFSVGYTFTTSNAFTLTDAAMSYIYQRE